MVDKARSGAASLDEVAHAFVENSLKGQKLNFQFNELFNDLPGFEEVLIPIVEKAYQEQLPQRKVSALSAFRDLLKILPDGSRTQAEKAFQAVEQGDSFVEAGDKNGLQAFIAKADLPIRKYFELRSKSLDLYAQASVLGDKPAEVLGLLSKVPACGQSKKTKDLALSALEKLAAGPVNPDADEILGVPAVQLLMKATLSENASKRETLVELYEKQVRSMIERASTEHLLDNFRMLIELRPDPNPANTALRMFAATHAKTPDLKFFAETRIDEIRKSGELSLAKKLRLIFGGFYGVFLPILVVILVAFFGIGGAAFVYFYFQFRRKESELYAQEEELQKETAESLNRYSAGQQRAAEEAKLRKPKFTGSTFGGRKPRGYISPLQGEDEYSRLLSLFGLDDQATESEIKKAYRDTVKNYHPDTAGHSGGDSEEEKTKFFIQAKETYDRILEIRGSWFGAKK